MRQRNNQEGSATFDQVFKAIGDPHRLKIIELLSDKAYNAGELLELIDIVQSTLSHHMKTLVEAGMVDSVRKGKCTYYTLNYENFLRAGDFLLSFRPDGDEKAEAEGSAVSPAAAESSRKKKKDEERQAAAAKKDDPSKEEDEEDKEIRGRDDDMNSSADREDSSPAEPAGKEDKDTGPGRSPEDIEENEEEGISEAEEKDAEDPGPGLGEAIESSDDDDSDSSLYSGYFEKKPLPKTDIIYQGRNPDNVKKKKDKDKNKDKEKDKYKDKGKKSKKGKKGKK